ncbi:hypothetical protein J6590_085471 [Homalodisca vitripennis]|nr:hypothetical protein J6590_085471 [Homalodisca vitripennis]
MVKNKSFYENIKLDLISFTGILILSHKMFTCYWSSLLPLLNSGASKIGVLLAEGESGIRNEGKAARAGFLLVDISGFSKQKQVMNLAPIQYNILPNLSPLCYCAFGAVDVFKYFMKASKLMN